MTPPLPWTKEYRGIATDPRALEVYFGKDGVSALAKIYVCQLCFEPWEVLATLIPASLTTFHLSHNIRLAALIWGGRGVVVEKAALCQLKCVNGCSKIQSGGFFELEAFQRVL